MAKAFSVTSWNVRHFGESEHNEERVAILADQEPAGAPGS
jgi:hypothetical protein